MALVGVVMIPPAPETMLQDPDPTPGTVAAKVVEVAQTTWSTPALALVGLFVIVITMLSVEAGQGALEIDQRRVYVLPCKPVKVEVGLVGTVTAPPAPERMLHDPVPMEGEFPARVVIVVQMVWSAPALATVGFGVITTCTSSVVAAQGALLVVQRRM